MSRRTRMHGWRTATDAERAHRLRHWQRSTIPPGSPDYAWRKRPVMLVFVLLLLISIGWALFRRMGETRRVIERMDPTERAQLFDSNFAAFKQTCPAQAADAFHETCSERARFLATFPECGSECRTWIAPWGAHPTR